MVLESQGDRGGCLLVTAAEEGLEMAGSVLLLYAGMRLLGLRPEPDGGYHLSIGDLMPSQAAEHAGLAGCRLPSAMTHSPCSTFPESPSLAKGRP